MPSAQFQCRPLSAQVATLTATAEASTPASEDAADEDKLPVEDLELLYHFLFEAVQSLPLEGERLHQMRHTYGVELGFQKHYLLHLILALSALHLFSTNHARTELISRAHAHQNAAIKLVNPVISNMTQEDCPVLFVFSGLMSIYCFADLVLRPFHVGNLGNALDEFIACIQLSRGVKSFISPYWPYLLTTWAAGALRSVNVDPSSSAREELRPHLEKLLEMCEASVHDDTEKDICKDTAETACLYIAQVKNSSERGHNARVMATPFVEMKIEFTTMLQRRDSVALVILAYQVILMHLCPDAWWVEGLAGPLLRHIEGLVKPEMKPLLAWPRQIVSQ